MAPTSGACIETKVNMGAPLGTYEPFICPSVSKLYSNGKVVSTISIIQTTCSATNLGMVIDVGTRPQQGLEGLKPWPPVGFAQNRLKSCEYNLSPE